MTFTLAHFSDPHLPPLPKPRLQELAGKRVLGYLNWTRNRHKYYRREVLDALVRDLQAERPDHIAVTGDLVNLALPAEFAPAQTWLRSVGAPQSVTAIPGNHDAYVRATRHRFVECFGDYLSGDEPAPQAFPFLRRRGPVALIGLSSAVPTAPFSATGTLGAYADRSAGAHSGFALHRTGFSRAAGASSAAVGLAAQAADRLRSLDRAAWKAWRRIDPARPRPHPFHHVVRRTRRKNPVDWRTGSVGAGARPAPGGGV